MRQQLASSALINHAAETTEYRHLASAMHQKISFTDSWFDSNIVDTAGSRLINCNLMT